MSDSEDTTDEEENVKVARNMKIVVVGDGTVGKTCLLHKFTKKTFTDTYEATIFENTFMHEDYRGLRFGLNLWDTAGQEGYDKLRPLSYDGTNVFLLAFDVTSRSTFKNIKLKWILELKKYVDKGAKIVLCSTKMDLLNDQELVKKLNKKTHTRPLTREEGVQLCSEIGAYAFVETSAKTGAHVDELFHTAIDAVHNSSDSGGACCTIL